MKSDVETLSPTRVSLTVEVPFDELKPSLDAAYQQIGAQVTISRLPQGQGAAALIDQRVRPRRRARRGRQRGTCPRRTARPCARTTSAPLGQPEVDVTEFADGGD